MTDTNSIFPPMDPQLRRRQALGKVYALLIRLAEERRADQNAAKGVQQPPKAAKANLVTISSLEDPLTIRLAKKRRKNKAAKKRRSKQIS